MPLIHAIAAVIVVSLMPVLAAAQPPATLAVTVNRASLTAGDPLVLGVDVRTPGGLPTADAVLVIVLPDGQTVVSVGPGGPVFGQSSNLRSLVPVARGLNLAPPVAYTNPAFFSYTLNGTEPAGTYTVYFALLATGALNDGVLGGGDVLALDTPHLAAITASASSSRPRPPLSPRLGRRAPCSPPSDSSSPTTSWFRVLAPPSSPRSPPGR